MKRSVGVAEAQFHAVIVPLLESHIVQLDERWFRVVEPTGWYRYFWRDEKDPTVLHGQNNWKGVIRGNSISVMADCGDRLDFRDGRIVSMDLKGRKLQMERTADGTVALKDDSSTLLAVQKGLTKEGLEMKWGNGELLGITQVARPLVEVIGGRAVIGRTVESLRAITRGNGEKRTWEYAVDEKLHPSLKQGDRLITWDPATRHVVKDGDKSYEIKETGNARENAAIQVSSGDGKTEFWHLDKSKGQEIMQKANGTIKTISWHLSGILEGKIRQKLTDTGKLISRESYSYDEEGVLKRFLNYINDELYLEKIYLGDGRYFQKRYVSGKIEESLFDEHGVLRAIRLINKE